MYGSRVLSTTIGSPGPFDEIAGQNSVTRSMACGDMPNNSVTPSNASGDFFNCSRTGLRSGWSMTSETLSERNAAEDFGTTGISVATCPTGTTFGSPSKILGWTGIGFGCPGFGWIGMTFAFPFRGMTFGGCASAPAASDNPATSARAGNTRDRVMEKSSG